jgi:phosphoribosylamine-glycine ligase
MENFLLVGNGAREHAIAEAVCRESNVRLFAFMSALNPGIAALAKKSGGLYMTGGIHSPSEVARFAEHNRATLAFPSPDAVLAAGVTDALLTLSIPCAAPTKAASRLEWDKSYARQLLKDYKVAGSPNFGIFESEAEAHSFIDSLGGQVAVKPSGLTGGKGVKVAGFHLKDADEAKKYASELLAARHAGLSSIVVEEKLEGEEFSLQAFSDGKRVYGMPLVQDHKRAYEGDLGPNCYSEDTEILTEDGWKKFDELDSNVKVAIYQVRFRRIRFEKPKAIYWQKYAGKMVSFKHREIDLLVTPNHRMLIQKRKGSRFTIIEAKNWEGENIIPQTGRWIGSQPKYFRIPESKNRFSPKSKSIKVPFKDWAEFMGLYLSEGYSLRAKRGSAIYICQTKSSKNYNKMRAILEKLPFHLNIVEKGFKISSIQLCEVLKGFGNANEKYVPSYIKNAKPETMMAFLSSFCLGDGDMHGGKMRLCSSSKRMIGDIQEMFLKTGQIGIITEDKRTTMVSPINRKTYPASTIYAIESKKRSAVGIRKNNVKTVDYSGYIGCVTVSTGFVVVRRKFRVAICGNTGGMGSYSDANHLLPFARKKHCDEALSIMQKTIEAFHKKEGKRFVGVLYGGFMITAKGVKLIEYNCRFGDPEAMNVLSILSSSLFATLSEMAEGGTVHAPAFGKKATVCKYLVPEGYPGKSLSDQPLSIDAHAIAASGARLYYASVYEKDGMVCTQSSRSIGLVGIADSLEEAEKIAEGACSFVSGAVWHRKDIGTPALVQKRVEHLKELGVL